MSIEKPLWLGPNPTTGEVPEYSAQADRQILATLFTEGIGNVQAGQLAVTQRAAGANMSVEVAAGTVYVTGDDVARQGLYRTDITATETVPIGAAPASNSRIDLVVARIYDAQVLGGTKHGLYLEVVQGTAAASPAAPAVPSSAVPLAQVLVAAGVTSIQNAAITDRRTSSSGGRKAQGIYTGNGFSSRSISVGFAPDLVLVNSQVSSNIFSMGWLHRADALYVQSVDMRDTGNFPKTAEYLTATGFSVTNPGSGGALNVNSYNYSWTAFKFF